ncbi:MAG: aldehyde dehydrogenase family protein [Acidobacteriota bacterium]
MDTHALGRDLETLAAARQRWQELAVQHKAAYLEQALHGTVRVADAQALAACRAKGISPDSPQGAEEWLGGPLAQARVLRLLLRTLRQIARHGAPRLPLRRLRRRPSGALAAEIFPVDLMDRLLYRGFRAEVWMQPGVTPEEVLAGMGSLYRQTPPPGRVALVLGAGNVASIGPLDAIHKLFAEGQVVILKMHEVNEYLRPFIEEAFAALIRDGFLRVVSGGPEVGAYLVAHPLVEEIHITGSDRTHDAIVYGSGDDGARRKAEDRPLVAKRLTSELGNVGPVIVVPGQWSDAELAFHAENIATQMANNAGFNCNAARVLLTSRRWPQRQALLDRLLATLARIPSRPAYYPGAEARYDHLLAANPRAVQVGERRPGVLPWTLVPDLSPEDHHNPCFTTEGFCSLTAETPLEAEDPAEFLAAAVAFANQRLWGTLNACILVDPRTRRRLGPRLEQAVEELRYGTVAINHWPAMGFALGVTTWGAYPGHTRQRIESGIGVVHNTMLFQHPEKSVIDGPFIISPRPPWFVTHPGAAAAARQLVRVEGRRQLAALLPLMLAAFKG